MFGFGDMDELEDRGLSACSPVVLPSFARLGREESVVRLVETVSACLRLVDLFDLTTFHP